MNEIANHVQELLKMPQELCHTCGNCCRIASFKGGLGYEEILKLANKEPESEHEAQQVNGAKDFLTIFKPYKNCAEARKVVPEFVDSTLKHLGKKEDEMSFFYCQYLGDDNLCKIHEDRPLLCRMYPIPHERTLFIKGCGFEQKSKENWAQIKAILKNLEELSKPISYMKGTNQDGDN